MQSGERYVARFSAQAMRDGLRHAVKCSAPSHAECPKFQRIVRAAAAGALGKRPKRAARLVGRAGMGEMQS